MAERERRRAERGYEGWPLERLYALFADETPRLGTWIDTTAQAPNETVDEILLRVRAQS